MRRHCRLKFEPLEARLLLSTVRITFDEITPPSYPDSFSLAELNAYFSDFGVSISGDAGDGFFGLANIEDWGTDAPSPPNLLYAGFYTESYSFTFNLSSPSNFFRFVRPGEDDAGLPGWTASAYDAQGTLLATEGENQIDVFLFQLPPRTVELAGPGITRVVFTVNPWDFRDVLFRYHGFRMDNVEFDSGPPPTNINVLDATTQDFRRFDIRYEVSGGLASEFAFRAYLSSNLTWDSSDVPLEPRLTVNAEAAGTNSATPRSHNALLTLAERAPVKDDMRFVLLVADADGEVDETDRSNNIAFAVPFLTPGTQWDQNAKTTDCVVGGQPTREQCPDASGPAATIDEGTEAFAQLRDLSIAWPYGIAPLTQGHPRVQQTVLDSLSNLTNLIAMDSESWPGTDFIITSAYRRVGTTAKSLHYDGRALDLQAFSNGSLGDLPRLGGLAWLAGFDWVWNEPPSGSQGEHIHVSKRASYCLPGRVFENVVLPEQVFDLAIVKTTDLQLRFAPLGLNFSVHAPEAGEICRAQSNVGTLVASIHNADTGDANAIGFSTAQATLTLNESGNIHWHTSGFEVYAGSVLGLPSPLPLGTYGPFDFDVHVSTLGLSVDTEFETIVRVAESFIHEQLSEQIFEPFTQILVIEDPGQTKLLVTDPFGRKVGMAATGEAITEIPGSAYFPSVPLAIVVAPSPGIYETTVRGITSGDFLLVTALVDGSQVVKQQSFSSRISAGQTIEYSTTLDPASGALNTVVVSSELQPAGSLDDGAWGYRERGIWNWGTGGFQADVRTRGAGAGTNTATWSLRVPPGAYEVFTTWTQAANRATNAPYTIFVDGLRMGPAVLTNQQAAPDDGTYAGRPWESLGVFNVSLGGITVQLSDAANGVVVADGIIVVPVGVPEAGGEGVDSADIGDVNMTYMTDLGLLPALLSLDADNDGFVAPSDALAVINYINSGVTVVMAPAGLGGAASVDVNADGYVSPLDALLVINQLNAARKYDEQDREATDVVFGDLAAEGEGKNGLLSDLSAGLRGRSRVKRR